MNSPLSILNWAAARTMIQARFCILRGCQENCVHEERAEEELTRVECAAAAAAKQSVHPRRQIQLVSEQHWEHSEQSLFPRTNSEPLP